MNTMKKRDEVIPAISLMAEQKSEGRYQQLSACLFLRALCDSFVLFVTNEDHKYCREGCSPWPKR